MKSKASRASAYAGGLAALLALAGSAPASPVLAQGTGVVEGTVTLSLPAPRRSASRYPGAPTQTHAVQQIPAVVYIRGTVAGVASRAGGAVAVLAQRDTAFAPSALVVQTGTTVRFPNEDSFFHNVFSYSAAARFDLGRYPMGEAKEVRFDEPGVVKVYCEVHEFMRAVVLVHENSFGVVADGDGRFRMEGVPPGSYTVVFWHPDLDPVERTVVVEGGATVRVNVELR